MFVMTLKSMQLSDSDYQTIGELCAIHGALVVPADAALSISFPTIRHDGYDSHGDDRAALAYSLLSSLRHAAVNQDIEIPSTDMPGGDDVGM